LNQEDSEEKDIQILLMGQIFSHATAVYCWLGDPNGQDRMGHAEQQGFESFIGFGLSSGEGRRQKF
jgi:hypothetical protein